MIKLIKKLMRSFINFFFAREAVSIWLSIGIFLLMDKPALLIIGAGTTGLVAAKELAAAFEITILEAAERPGGRIRTLDVDGTLVEAGAEFIHGNLPLTFRLLKEANIKPIKVSGEMYRSQKGKFLKVPEMTEGWAGLLEKMQAVETDLTVLEFLDKNYNAPRYASLRRHVTSFLAGFDLADVSRASVKSILKEWLSEEDDNYRLPQGYGGMVNFLVDFITRMGVTLRTGLQVTSVSWEEGKVVVSTREGQEFKANKLLVTVPVSVLQSPPGEGGIRFMPPIHFNQQVASMIGFGAVVKIVLKFRKPFWQPDAGFILSDQPIPTWWTRLPSPEPVLTGWVGGPPAAALSKNADEFILNKALVSLAAIYHCSSTELQENLVWSKVFNWQKMEHVRGGYSYATLETSAAQQLIATPLAGTLFFAGEGLYSGGHPGTVEAAISAAMNIARTIRADDKC